MRVALLIGVLCAWTPPQQDIAWIKLDQAKAIASHTNKLILVYVACDPRSGSAPCSGQAVERSFAEASIVKRQEDFHFVRIADKKTAQLLRAAKPPEAIVLDADGEEVYRSGFTDAATLDKALGTALHRSGPREVRWGNEVVVGLPGRPLLVVGFDDEKGEALKAFEDRMVAKYHDRIEFVKFSAKKDVDQARRWGVAQGPVVFLCDSAQEHPEKHPIEKLPGKRSPAQLKASIQKALLKLEPKK